MGFEEDVIVIKKHLEERNDDDDEDEDEDETTAYMHNCS